MNTKKLKFSALFIAVLIIGLSNSFNPPNGRTGAPGDTTCEDCHGGSGGGIDGLVDISGVPSSIDPNTTYTLTVTSEFTSGSPTRAGFQMVVLDNSDDDVGTLSNASSSSTITPSGGRTYFEHDPAINFNGNTTVSWEVDWTSPSGPDMEDITFYASTLLANGNGGTGGDKMKLTDVTGTLEVPVIVINLEIIQEEDISCFGLEDGFALVEVSGGTPPYSFSWDNGETSNPAVALPGGENILIVTDDLGATESITVEIVEPSELDSDSNITNVSCFNLADGSILALPFGGTGDYAFNWEDGSSNDELTNLASGNYALTITDDNGCESFFNFDIATPDEITIDSEDILDAGCFELGSISITTTGGSGSLISTWSHGVVGNEIADLDPGFYTVTISDLNDCALVQDYEILGPSVFEYSSTITNPECAEENDGSIELILGVNSDFSTIDWSNGDTGTFIESLSGGTYSVTIVDVFNCVYEENFNIINPAELTIIDFNITDASCGAFGSIEIIPTGGTGTLNSNWSNGATGTIISDLSGGDYTVEVFDENNCSFFQTFTVQQSEGVIYQSIATQPNCMGDNNAMIELIFNSIADYESIQWSTGATTTSITSLLPGSYSVTITDADQCVYNEDFQIAEPQELILSATPSNEILCFGSTVDDLTLNSTGGTAPYSIYAGSTLISGPLTNLSAGTYVYNVVDANGCVDTLQFSTANPTELQFSTTTTSTTTTISMDGAVVINMNGGTPPYTTNGTNFMSSQMFGGFSPGFFQYTIIDSANCSIDISFTISDGTIPCDDLVLDLTITQPSCLGEEPIFSPSITGGTPPYSTVFQTQAFYDGDYTVGFVDANNCTVSQVVTINYTDTEGPQINVVDVIVALDASGNLEPYNNDVGTVDNCGGPVTLETITMLPDLSGPSTTTMTAMATDEIGNTSTQTFILTVIDTIAPTISCMDDLTVTTCVDVEVMDPIVTDNSGSFTLTVIENESFNLGENELIYIAEDSFGNSDTCIVVITAEVDIDYTISPINPACAGESTGSIEVSSVNESIVDFENGFDGLESGTYYFTITDVSSSCSVFDSITLIEPDPLFISNEIIIQLSESGASDGAIEITIEGGNLPYAYNWINQDGNTVSSDASVNNLSEGTYTCIITDNFGCIIETQIISISFESSIANSYLQQVEIYPNPFMKEIIIDSPWTLDMINIYSAQGKLVFAKRNPGSSINLDQLDSGLYLIEMIKNDEKAIKRIIKQ